MAELVGITAQYRHGSVAELHGLDMPVDGERNELWVMRPTTAAVAMGSAQRSEQFDHDQLTHDNVELAARRSGGGAVLVDPASTVWVDVLAPRSSPWWSSELAENFLIVGRVWQQALASLGVETDICTHAPENTDVARHACWAGLGWGELTVGDAKVVGLSQRRTRWGARVQAMGVVDRSSATVARYLAPEVRDDVKAAVAGHEMGISVVELEAAVVQAFQTPI